jgi:carboxyl-terminal processing protease
MLSHFVPKWKNTVVVKYLDGNKNYISKGYDSIDFSKYTLVFLQNGWSASASEIMIWTLKDYYPDSTIIWTQSYGKGSVQTIKSYRDDSSLKFTIARWFTWKFENGIDGVGIKPDVELEFDFDTFKTKKLDNQLNAALKLR